MRTKRGIKRLNPPTGLLCFMAVLAFVIFLPAKAPLWKIAVLLLVLFASGIIFLSASRLIKKLGNLTLILLPLIIFILAASPIFSKEAQSQAIYQVGQITLRALAVVLADLIFILSHKAEDLLAALYRMKVPAVFIGLLSSGIRYMHIQKGEALCSFRARLARDRCKRTYFERLKITGLIIEKIFWRTIDRSQRVYAGMLSRGFDGNMYFHKNFRLKALDLLTAVSLLMALIFLARV